MIKCLIVDDEPLARSLLRGYLQHFGDFSIVGECSDAVEAMQFLAKEKVELLFLDVDMPQMSGIELLRQLSVRPLTILCTAHSEYALESYDLDVVDYLLKPIGMARFSKAIAKVLKRLDKVASSTKEVPAKNGQSNSFFVKSDYKKIKIEPSDILFIEAMEKYVRIHLLDAKVMTLMSMSAILNLLDDHQFLRIHRSYIINKQFVEALEGNRLLIKGQKLPISKVNRAVVRDFLNIA